MPDMVTQRLLNISDKLNNNVNISYPRDILLDLCR